MTSSQTTRARYVSAASAAAFLILAACSTTAQAKRDSRLRQELDAHVLQQPLPAVWPAALRLVAENGYQLVGRDRAVVGSAKESRWRRLTSGGFQTSKLGDGGLVLETMEGPSRIRLRIEGTDLGSGTCRVMFIAIQRTGAAPSEVRSRDIDLEVELLRRLEPDEAARIVRLADDAAK